MLYDIQSEGNTNREDRMKHVCSVCHGYYDDNGLTGEIWTDEPGVSHGYCPSCLEKTLAEEEK